MNFEIPITIVVVWVLLVAAVLILRMAFVYGLPLGKKEPKKEYPPQGWEGA